MKLLTILSLSLLVSASAFANNNLNSLQEKLNNKIIQFEESNQQNTQSKVEVDVPWSTVDKRETDLWKSVVGAYDYLKRYSVVERYNFLYEGVRASTLDNSLKVNALEKWIKKENNRLVNKRLNPKFYIEWKQHVSNIENSISEIGKTRPDVFAETNVNNNTDYFEFLNEIKTDIEALRSIEVVTPPVVVKNVELTTPLTEDQRTGYYILFAGCLISLFVGLAYPRKKAVKVVYRNKKTKSELPALPTEAFEKLSAQSLNTGVSIEEECRKMIEENSHLLEVAQLQIHPVSRSPFKTTVNATQEQIAESLSWLLKGTIAIANTNRSKISHVEWNCKETSGRVSLEFILHGIECDYKSLYMNTLIEGDASAPAHFGRSEMALEGHLPTVLFKTGNKRTTVSLGLDSLNSSLSH